MKDSNLFPVTIFLSSIILAGSIVYHAERISGSGGLSLLRAKNNNNVENTVNTDTPTNPSAPNAPIITTVSIDDDPVLGDKNAPITIIEFSDYECPFCQRHFKETHAELVEKYVETGIANIVFRDLPLSFHDPVATKAAIAANCVKEQTNDAGYYTFHDLWFANTVSNGQGVSDDKMREYATTAGANADSFTKCVNEERYKDEVQKDLADATSYGASATPSFFIGKNNGGSEFEAELLIGAQPFSAFEAIIDKLAE